MIWITEPEGFPDTALRLLREHLPVVVGEEIKGVESEIQYIICRLKIKWDQTTLSNFPALKILVTPTTGITHIDVAFCENNEIEILSLREHKSFLRNVRATIEFTIFLTLYVLRCGENAFRSLEKNEWSREGLKGREISGKKILFIGFGRVGSEVAKIISAFGGEVFYIDPQIEFSEFTKIDISQINEIHFDIIYLTAAFTGETIVNQQILSEFPDESIFINTARGELIDHFALLNKLKKNRNFIYCADVFDAEHNLGDLYIEFLKLGTQCYLTPHIAGYSYESLPKVENFICGKLIEKILK